MRWRRERQASDGLGLKAEVEQLRSLLNALLELAAEAGVTVESAARDALTGVPPALIAASRTRHSAGGEPVMLSFPGAGQVLAVVSGAGDPQRWWEEIVRVGPPSPAAGGVLRLSHARLVTGLDALAVPEAGSVALTVSRALDPAGQRAAVRTAMRAARRAGWLPSRVPAWIAAPLIFRRHGLAILSGKAHAAIAGAAALTAGAVVATTLIAAPAAPQGSVRIIPVRPGIARAVTVHRHRRRPVRTRVPSAGTRTSGPAVAAVGSTPQPSPQPQPQPSSQAPAPLPTVSASVSASGPVCVWVLGLKVCLPL